MSLKCHSEEAEQGPPAAPGPWPTTAVSAGVQLSRAESTSAGRAHRDPGSSTLRLFEFPSLSRGRDNRISHIEALGPPGPHPDQQHPGRSGWEHKRDLGTGHTQSDWRVLAQHLQRHLQRTPHPASSLNCSNYRARRVYCGHALGLTG